MSMEIDFSTPLTDEERAFLLERGRYADVERADNAHGGSSDDSLLMGDGTGPDEIPVTTSENNADRKRRLLLELAAIEEAEGGSDEDEDDEGDLPPYSAWKPADLDAELTARGLPKGGTKAEKVARLEADDDAKNQPQQ